MSVASQDDSAQQAPRKRMRRRWIFYALVALTPFALLYALLMAPVWIHDHQLTGLADRILRHPTPPGGTGVSSYEPQQMVSGDSGDCWVSVRFDLVTDRPAEEVLKHYEAAEFAKGDERYTDFSVNAWVHYGSDQAEYGYQRIIVCIEKSPPTYPNLNNYREISRQTSAWRHLAESRPQSAVDAA